MWPNFRKPSITFVINSNIKAMGKIQKSNNKIMQVIDYLDSQWINALINKSWVSLCLPAHWEFKNLCFVLVLGLVLELWPFVHIAVTKEFMDDLLSVNMPSLSGMEIYIDRQLYLGGWRNPIFNFVHHCISKLWLFVQAPVDFFLNSLHTKLFICLTCYPEIQ